MCDVKVSLIVPVYNDGAYLRRSLPALAGQDFGDFELILVDDGSTDGSSEILDDFARRSPVARVVHKENGGASSARNAGLRIARGEWIVFADSDDIVSPRYIRDLYEGVGDCDMAWHGETKVHPNGVDVAAFCTESRVVDMYSLAEVTEMMNTAWRTNFPGPCCKIYRKELFMANGIFMEEDMVFGEDFHCLLKVLERCSRVKIISGCAQNYLYYQNSDSVTYNTRSFDCELASFVKLDAEIRRFVELKGVVGNIELFAASVYGGKRRVMQSLYSPQNNYSKRQRIANLKRLKRDSRMAGSFFHGRSKANKLAVLASDLGLWSIVDKLARRGCLS